MHPNFTVTKVVVFEFDGEPDSSGYKWNKNAKSRWSTSVPVIYEYGPAPMMVGTAILTRDGNRILADMLISGLHGDPGTSLKFVQKLVPMASCIIEEVKRDQIKAFSIQKIILVPKFEAPEGSSPLGDYVRRIPGKEEMH